MQKHWILLTLLSDHKKTGMSAFRTCLVMGTVSNLDACQAAGGWGQKNTEENEVNKLTTTLGQ